MLVPLHGTTDSRLYFLYSFAQLLVADVYRAMKLLLVRIWLSEFSSVFIVSGVISLSTDLGPLWLVHFVNSIDEILIFDLDLNSSHERQLSSYVAFWGFLLFVVLGKGECLEVLCLKFIFDCGFHVLDGIVVFGFVLKVKELFCLVNCHWSKFGWRIVVEVGILYKFLWSCPPIGKIILFVTFLLYQSILMD